MRYLILLSIFISACADEGGGSGGGCDITCICDGFPARPMDMGPCSACNPFGEISINVPCPQSVAIDGLCQFEITSSAPLTLGIQLPLHTVRTPGGTITTPTNANLPGGNVTITVRRINDNLFDTHTFHVQDTCQ